MTKIYNKESDTMFKEFIENKNKFDTSYPIKKYAKFDYIQRRYFAEAMKIKEYYKYQRVRSVNNSHILARLIDMVSPSIGLDIVSYFKSVSTNAKFISKQFDIVSNINRGKIMEGILTGKNAYEVLLYTENDIDIFEFENNWKDVEGLRVIKTDNTDLDFNFPFKGDKSFETPKLFVYEIDIIKIALQYRSWALEQLKYSKGNDSTEFVAMFLLPNTIDQILDYSIYNRFIKIATQQYIPVFKIKQPFHVLDYSSGIDTILRKIVKDVKNANIPLEQLLDSIPTITGNKMKDVISLSPRYFTAQSEWLLWLAKIEDIVNLHKILGKNGYKRNKDLFHRLPIIIKIIERRHSNIMAMLPEWLKDDFNKNVEYIKDNLGKR